MDIQQALDIKKSILTIADSFNMEDQKVAEHIVLGDKDRHKIMMSAHNLWNEFDDAPIEKRAKMLGFTVTTENENNN